MKRIFAIIALSAMFSACQEPEVAESEFTGNEITYALLPGSAYQVSGTVSVKEKKDGSSLIKIELSGTEGDIELPVHIHFGNISAPDADVAALLNPVTGKTGLSETTFTKLADESNISYAQFVAMNACIKVHLSATGADKNVVLAAGNIGVASSSDLKGGRTGVSVCKSE